MLQGCPIDDASSWRGFLCSREILWSNVDQEHRDVSGVESFTQITGRLERVRWDRARGDDDEIGPLALDRFEERRPAGLRFTDRRARFRQRFAPLHAGGIGAELKQENFRHARCILGGTGRGPRKGRGVGSGNDAA